MRSLVADLSSQPIQNLFKYPNIGSGSTGWSAASGADLSPTTDSLAGGQALQVTTTATSASQGCNMSPITGMVASGFSGPHTGSAWVKIPVGIDLIVNVEEYTTAGSYVGGGFVNHYVGTGGWVRVQNTKSIATPGNVARLYVRTSAAVATTFIVDKAMMTVGDKLYDYADGDTPGWMWLGSPGASASVGYPYRLESIAGAPLAMADASVGGNNTKAVSGIGLSSTVYNVLMNPTKDNNGIGGLYGSSVHRSLAVGASGATVGQLVVGGEDTSGGSAYARLSGVYTTGQPVICAGTRDATRYMIYSPGVDYAAANFSGPQLDAANINAYSTCREIVFAYNGVHSEDTISRVMAWLANRYGVPINTGGGTVDPSLGYPSTTHYPSTTTYPGMAA